MSKSKDSQSRASALKMIESVYVNNLFYRGRVRDLLDIVEVGQAHRDIRVQEEHSKLLEVLKGIADFTQDRIDTMKGVLDDNRSRDIKAISKTVIASAVVLSHSHLDHSLNTLIGASIFCDWDKWMGEILKADQKTYKLSDVLRIDIAAEQRSAASRYLGRIAARSVLNRNKLLLSHVGIFGRDSTEKRMSSVALRELDDRRHGVIHKNHLWRNDFAEGAPSSFQEVFSHVANLIESMGNAYDLDVDEFVSRPSIKKALSKSGGVGQVGISEQTSS